MGSPPEPPDGGDSRQASPTPTTQPTATTTTSSFLHQLRPSSGHLSEPLLSCIANSKHKRQQLRVTWQPKLCHFNRDEGYGDWISPERRTFRRIRGLRVPSSWVPVKKVCDLAPKFLKDKGIMEAAMAKAKEIGRTLLGRATTTSVSSSDEDVDVRGASSYRTTWSQIVASPPKANHNPECSLGITKHPVSIETAGKPGPRRVDSRAGEAEDVRSGNSSGRMKSPERIFTADDVAKLVELARSQLRKEEALREGGWQEVESKERRHREKTYAKHLVDGFTRSPDMEVRCWQCNRTGHMSSACPRGKLCFVCNSPNHKRVDCPQKRRPSRAEKGKAVLAEPKRTHAARWPEGGPITIRGKMVHRRPVDGSSAATVEKRLRPAPEKTCGGPEIDNGDRSSANWEVSPFGQASAANPKGKKLSSILGETSIRGSSGGKVNIGGTKALENCNVNFNVGDSQIEARMRDSLHEASANNSKISNEGGIVGHVERGLGNNSSIPHIIKPDSMYHVLRGSGQLEEGSVWGTKYIVGPSHGKGKYKEGKLKSLGSLEGVAQPVCHSTLISKVCVDDKASSNGNFMETQGPREDDEASYAGSVWQEGLVCRELRTTGIGEKKTKGEGGPPTQESIYGKFGRNMVHDIRILSYKLSKTSRNKMKQALLFGKTVLEKAKRGWKVADVGSDQDQERSGLSFDNKDQAWIDASESVDSRVLQEAQHVVGAMPSVESGANDSYPSLYNPMGEIKQARINNRRQLRVLADGVRIGKRIVPQESDIARASVSRKGIKSTKKKDIRCWQCWNWGHSSNGCRLGNVCFLCRRPGHKKAECHLQNKLSMSIDREIADGNRQAQSSAELRSNKQTPSTAEAKGSNMGVIFEQKNDILMGDVGKEIGYNRNIEAKTVETVIGAVATNLGVERNKTYEMGEGESDMEMKSNTVGNMLTNVEIDLSQGKASIFGVGSTDSSASVFVGDNKDLDVSSPCNDKGVCGAGIEKLTGEKIVDAANVAKVDNEENRNLRDNRDHSEKGRESARKKAPLTNTSTDTISLFDVIDEDSMINLNKVLGISLPPGATCQIYRDLERNGRAVD